MDYYLRTTIGRQMDNIDSWQTPDDTEMDEVSHALEEEDVAGTRLQNVNAHIKMQTADIQACRERRQLVERSNARHVRLATCIPFQKITDGILYFQESAYQPYPKDANKDTRLGDKLLRPRPTPVRTMGI